jgi:hypothetical protein
MDYIHIHNMQMHIHTYIHAYLHTYTHIHTHTQNTKVYPKVSGLSPNEIYTYNNTRWEAAQRVMASKLTRLTHKIMIQLHLVAESCTISVLAPGGQSGNFWIHPRIFSSACCGIRSGKFVFDNSSQSKLTIINNWPGLRCTQIVYRIKKFCVRNYSQIVSRYFLNCIPYIGSNRRTVVKDELERPWPILMQQHSRFCLEELENCQEADFLAENRSRDVPSTKQECHLLLPDVLSDKATSY